LSESIDAAIVAVPTVLHEEVALKVAKAGVNVLVEKPIAASLDAAVRIEEAFAKQSLIGAVGHVERFNPALQSMKSRLQEGALGRVFSISTVRVGPFPDRISDVGVVKDLATHDIDLVRWLGEAEFETVHGYTAYKLGREQEDLLAASGFLANGVVVNMQVNWLTPAKRRAVTVLGERGAFVGDMLTADLTFYSNGSVPTEWDAVARLRGVSEGDMVRYALRKPEPLRLELEVFRDAVLGRNAEHIVSLSDGVETLRVAERILKSARSANLEVVKS
jgi:predicted dehydrogenase